MSHQLIDHSPDLLRLRNEGYDIDVVGGYLLVRNVPYVNSIGTIQLGVLISQLELSGDRTAKPSKHVAMWTGEHPCHADGRKITEIENGSPAKDLGQGIHANFTFSAKADYRDYYHKITTYIGRISGEAAKVNPETTAQIFPAIPEESDEQVFKYIDTASSRANLGEVSGKLSGQRIGIVGLGGTGSYILDLVAKTWVAEIHIFDGDVFSQHNAFRSPGAPSLEQLQERPQKVIYHAVTYSNMRNGIVVHDEFMSKSSLTLLDGLTFVFICIDQGDVKHLIVNRLISNEVAFVDVGMGIHVYDGQLGGIVRSVISTPDNRNMAAPHISYDDSYGGNDEYATNIQIAELNAMNAAMAVIQWKKYYGVYQDVGGQCYSGYSISAGEIATESAK